MFGKKCTTCDKIVGGLFGKRNWGTTERRQCEACSEREMKEILQCKKEQREKEQREKEQREKEQRENIELLYQRTKTVEDADGNVYQTVKIGNQVWTAENLQTTKYNDNTPIRQITPNDGWYEAPGYCWYNDYKNKQFKCGALYNWHAVNTNKLAPVGWHVPTSLEWNIMRDYLIANGYNWDGTTDGNKIAKALAANSHWKTDKDPGTIGNDLSKNNKTGFSALPGGYRHDGVCIFTGIGEIGGWWCADLNAANEAQACDLTFGDYSFGLGNGSKNTCFSVRLIKD